MQNYESGKPSYFATRQSCLLIFFLRCSDSLKAPVQLVYALHTSLKSITSAPLADRFKAHKAASAYIKDSLAELGLEFVPKSRDIAANGMTAVRFPKGLKAPDVLPKLAE